MAQAFRDGKLTEAERAWAEKFASGEPEAFREWCAAAPKRVPSGEGIEQRCGTAEFHGVYSAEERNILEMLGIAPETINQINKEK